MNITQAVSQDKWSEDLISQAARSLEIGRTHCTCKGTYHALWGALRAANLDGKQEAEVPTLTATLSPLIAENSRIMIAGSADPGLLCKVGRISGNHQTDISIVERCQAPLKLIQEFISARKIPSQLFHCDILNLDGALKWDIILLHYTITFVAPDDRQQFFDRLARSLSKNGTLVCMARTGKKTDPNELESLKAAYFHESREALRRHQLDVHWDEAELDYLLGIYAEERAWRKVLQPSVEEIEGFLSNAGLAMVSEINTGLKRSLNVGEVKGADIESSSIVLAGHS